MRYVLLFSLIGIFQAQNAHAGAKYFGYYWVIDGAHQYDYLNEIRGHSNIIVLNHYYASVAADLQRAKDLHQKVILHIGFSDGEFAEPGPHIQSVRDSIPPHLLDTIAFIQPSEEWFRRRLVGLLNSGWPQSFPPNPTVPNAPPTVAAVKGRLEAAITQVKAKFPGIPVMTVEPSYSGSNFPPAANADVLGLDAYLVPPSGDCGATEREQFDAQVTAEYAQSAAHARPMMMVAGAYSEANHPMPSNCQLQWYFDLAQSRSDTLGVLWFLYADTDAAIGLRNSLYVAQRNYLRQLYKDSYPATINAVIDIPALFQSYPHNQLMHFGGWACDANSFIGSGISAVHAYAYPSPWPATPAIFLGAQVGGNRPDVAPYCNVGGSATAAFDFLIPAGTLPPGDYMLVAFLRSITMEDQGVEWPFIARVTYFTSY